MRRPSALYGNDSGLEEAVSVTLMVILAIALAAVIASIVFGVVIWYPKSAYIAVQAEAKNFSADNWYISVYDMGGDIAHLNRSTAKEGMPVDFQVTLPDGRVLYPTPDGPITWKPGDTLFIYNKSGNLTVTLNETLARAGPTGLPKGVWRFDVIDGTDNVLIYTKNIGVGVATPTPTVTTYTITPSVSGGNGAVSPATVQTVNSGATPTFTFTAAPGYHLNTVTVDGSLVTPSGNSYTFPVVTANHNIVGTFTLYSPLIANFNFGYLPGKTVWFTDTSTGNPDSWEWNFGDGSVNSTIKNPPDYIYQSSNDHNVILTVRRSSDGATSSVLYVVKPKQNP
jgi:hypothetical protein